MSGYAEDVADHPGFGLVRWVSVLLLAVVGLFYLQFGLQALVHFVPQGILSLVGGIALLWGAVRRARGFSGGSAGYPCSRNAKRFER